MLFFTKGDALDKYYLPVMAPIGVTGNILSFLVSLFCKRTRIFY